MKIPRFAMTCMEFKEAKRIRDIMPILEWLQENAPTATKHYYQSKLKSVWFDTRDQAMMFKLVFAEELNS